MAWERALRPPSSPISERRSITLSFVDAFETVHAEPRDEIEVPSYRVNFWQRPSVEYGWQLDAHVLTDAEDVTAVLQWASDHAHGRDFEVFVETENEPVTSFETPRTVGLVRLFGSNPNGSETVEIGPFTEA